MWRCRCGYWENRNGGPPPECPYCATDQDNHERHKHLTMDEAFRVAPPDFEPSIWEDL